MLNFIGALPGAVSQGLIWGLMAIGEIGRAHV